MIHFNQTEEIIRNADDVCYAMNVTIKAYGSPLVTKTRTYNLNSTDDTTATPVSSHEDSIPSTVNGLPCAI